MTREEAIKFAEHAVNMTDIPEVKEFYRLAASALRPVSREQVEGIRGKWMFPIFANQDDPNDPHWQCSECGSIETPLVRHRFCPACGAPVTDEAVQMALERLEALYEKID